MTRNTIYLCLLFAFIGCRTLKVKESKKISEIIFVKENVLIDKELLKQSISKMQDNLKKEVLKERAEDSLDTDLIALDNMMKMSESIYYNSKIENVKKSWHYQFSDSLIISHQKLDDKIIGDYTVINRNNHLTYKLAKIDSLTIFSRGEYKLNDTDILVKEYRDSIKVINDYECFKVSFTRVKNGDEDFPFTVKTYYELYVTDKIELKFHPIFRYKKILSKYFPLEIKESNDFDKGIYTIYRTSILTN